jgi:[protein-PII] uridylyltransferase
MPTPLIEKDTKRSAPAKLKALPQASDLAALLQSSQGDARAAILAQMKPQLAAARAAIAERVEAGESGILAAQAYARFMDDLIISLADHITTQVHRATNPTRSERLTILAVGGFGRGRLAPGSDIDILFLLPYKQTPWGESVVETILYVLWDLGLKVGHASRSVDESIRQARADMTIRTAMLEGRLLWGDAALYEDLRQRYWAEVALSPGLDFIDAKLAERENRHRRMGESRYLVEPQIKDGKGGLRDLESLYWIGKYLFRVDSARQLVNVGLLREDEWRKFEKAEKFLWTVRVHLHLLTGRAEERLTFDVQTEMARRLGYVAHAGLSAVERFMKHYFLVAKDVGDLTRIFCATLEDQQHKYRPGLRRFLPRFGGRPRRIGDFINDNGRLELARPDAFEKDPVNLLKLFQVADQLSIDIHPNALREVTRSLRLVDKALRANPEANAVFMKLLASRHNPERALRRLNEAGVFGRFVPDFGRIVAMMQFNMYHHYTVDEHLLRAIGILAQIERGELAEDLPLSNEVIHKIVSREVLFLAVLLHDIAKGREEDHSDEGAQIARRMGPRLGLSPGETETVTWLVQNHLLMSDFAQKRDLSDPKTVVDFAEQVQSPERLRLLLVLTVADIRAVGPGTWNGWKGQLLRQLYKETEAVLSGGLASDGRKARVAHAQEALAARLSDWSNAARTRLIKRHYDAYWLSANTDTHVRHAQLMRKAETNSKAVIIDAVPDRFRAVTEVTLYTADHPGLFARVAGAFAVAGANIVDAKIHTTVDGYALDTFWVQATDGSAFEGVEKLTRLEMTLAQALSGEVLPRELLATRLKRPTREAAFRVEPLVLIDNNASNTWTVIEVNGRDRPGLLHDLTRSLFGLNLTIGSAHIATYGERAVDVFYVRDLMGQKITHGSKLRAIETRLLDGLGETKPTAKAKPGSKPRTIAAA